MPGMNAATGKKMNDVSHINQSIRDILTTPIGSRVMRRNYGSLLPDLIDQPLHGPTLLQCYAASAMAIAQWEPRVTIEKIEKSISAQNPGAITLLIDVIRLDTGTPERARLNVALTAGNVA